MDFFPVNHVAAIGEKNRSFHSRDLKKKPTKGKIADLALDAIPSFLTAAGSLWGSPGIPQFLDLIFDLHTPPVAQQKLVNSFIPIGIIKCDYNRWINAFLQFLLFIPSLCDMFIYTPKRFFPFLEFIQKYHQDRKLGKKVTTAKSSKLLETIRKNLSFSEIYKMRPESQPWQVLRRLMKSLGEPFQEEDLGLLALNPYATIIIDKDNFSWEEAIEKELTQNGFFSKAKVNLSLSFPLEMLLILQEKSLLPKKQFSLSYHGIPYALYELDAFVEYRPDGWDTGDFFTYVKTQGQWYQCDDTHIVSLKPIHLTIPLRRAIFCHVVKRV